MGQERNVERKTGKGGRIFPRAPTARNQGACGIKGFKAQLENHGTLAIGGQGSAARESQIAGVYSQSISAHSARVECRAFGLPSSARPRNPRVSSLGRRVRTRHFAPALLQPFLFKPRRAYALDQRARIALVDGLDRLPLNISATFASRRRPSDDPRRRDSSDPDV